MIFNYGFSIVGKSHIEKDTCCQDAHKIRKMDNGWYVAAIADGVGSAKNSHIGSKIAADTVVDFCAECMPWDYSIIGIKSMLRTAYNYAFKKIIRESEKSGEPIESYDTTLSVVIYDGRRIIYGHSGDGAIIGLTIYGDYVQITKPQKGEDMISVLPLRAGYTVWSIDTYEEDLAAVMLMTDGMLDGALCPYLLKLSNVSEVYTPIASFFADPYGIAEDENQTKTIKNDIKDFIVADEKYNIAKFYDRLLEIYKKHLGEKSEELITDLKEKNYPLALMQSVQDDKTMVALINTENVCETKDVRYFSDPDWDELQEEWNKRAYPHLYTERMEESSVENKNDTNSDDENKDNERNQTDDAIIDSKKEDAVSSTETDKTLETLSTPANRQTTVHKNYEKTKDIESVNKQDQKQVYFIPPSNSQTQNKQNSAQFSIQQKHDKPKKRGLFGKATDLIEKSVNVIETFFADDDVN